MHGDGALLDVRDFDCPAGFRVTCTTCCLDGLQNCSTSECQHCLRSDHVGSRRQDQRKSHAVAVRPVWLPRRAFTSAAMRPAQQETAVYRRRAHLMGQQQLEDLLPGCQRCNESICSDAAQGCECSLHSNRSSCTTLELAPPGEAPHVPCQCIALLLWHCCDLVLDDTLPAMLCCKPMHVSVKKRPAVLLLDTLGNHFCGWCKLHRVKFMHWQGFN